MALSLSDLDNLDAAIATGELSVVINGRSITYRSVSELLKARSHVANVLALAGTDGRGAKRAGAAYRYTFTTGRGD
ncbi:phage head-tail joining protein [Chitinimonas sp. PSY-7]|uniref:phage head-tail joining protein n=1 Tax=Chitinimonas sp. PSY-7 TaxID=3459088 RepID=UPI00404035F7